MMMLYLLNLSTDAHATASYFCFKIDHQQNILLVSAEEFPEIKTIQYYPYLKRIDLKFSHYNAIDTARDRPSGFHDFYKEIIDNQVMGTYEVIYQGAMFSTINHTAKNNHRPTKFERIYHLDPNTRQNLNRQGIDCF